MDKLAFLLDNRARKYDNEFYKPLKAGKKEKAEANLAELVTYSYLRTSQHCPKCGTLLLMSDMPRKDYVCLPCMRYFTEKELEVLADKKLEEKIDKITEDFMRLL